MSKLCNRCVHNKLNDMVCENCWDDCLFEEKPVFVLDFDAIAESGIQFDELSDYDKCVFETIGNLFLNGQDEFSVRQIYIKMRYFSSDVSPATTDENKIKTSISKMSTMKIKYVDDYYELLPITINNEHTVFNGGITGYSIKIERLPLLFEYAFKNNFASPMSASAYRLQGFQATDINLAIRRKIITMIIKGKRANDFSISFNGLFKAINYTKREDHYRIRRIYAQKILEHFKQTKFITDYRVTDVGITFTRGK